MSWINYVYTHHITEIQSRVQKFVTKMTKAELVDSSILLCFKVEKKSNKRYGLWSLVRFVQLKSIYIHKVPWIILSFMLNGTRFYSIK